MIALAGALCSRFQGAALRRNLDTEDGDASEEALEELEDAGVEVK